MAQATVVTKTTIGFMGFWALENSGLGASLWARLSTDVSAETVRGMAAAENLCLQVGHCPGGVDCRAVMCVQRCPGVRESRDAHDRRGIDIGENCM
jgi:hypothetical protein